MKTTPTAAHLAARLRHLIIQPQFDVAGPTDDTTATALIDAVERGETLSKQETAQLIERIRAERPAAVISAKGDAKIGRRAADLFPDWIEFLQKTRQLFGSVARIDFNGTGEATAFLVAPTHMLTNRHVADDLHLQPGQPTDRIIANFLGASTAPEVRIAEVAAVSAEADLAMLQLSQDPNLPPLNLSGEQPATGLAITAVGYPEAGLYGDAAGIFQSAYGIAHASPGRICHTHAGTFQHDCSTLGGNSGSPIFDQSTGTVIGVQSEGAFLELNTAVSAKVAGAFVQETLARVH